MKNREAKKKSKDTGYLMQIIRLSIVTAFTLLLSLSGSVFAQQVETGDDPVIITNDGTISATNTGISSSGDSVVIINEETGIIETSGDDSSGIFSGNGRRVEITNSGTITVNGLHSEGIYSSGADVMITNSGTITATGEGISVHGNDAMINNSGTIETSGARAHGVFMNSIDGIIINSGTIETTGNNSDGIFSGNGRRVEITNSGVIVTSGGQSNGLSVTSEDAEITNSGTIETSGARAHGVYLGGALGSVITNSGTIETNGAEAYGVYLEMASGTVTTNSGTIETTGANAHGIVSTGLSTMIINSAGGMIITTGADAHGISGVDAQGISSTGTGDIINDGTIITTGANAHGIFSTGNNNDITINGKVSATGEGAFAVQGSDAGDQTLTLGSGAIIRGGINLGERAEPAPPADGAEALEFVPDNDVFNVITNVAGSSRTYVTEGVETFGLGELAMRNGNGTVAVVDPTAQSATRITLGATTGRVHRQVFQRLASVRGKPAGKGAWGSFLGGYTKRGGDGLAQAWKHNFYGGVGGFDTRLPGGQQVGVFAGGGRGQIRASGASVRDGASRAFFGAYGQQSLGRLTFDGSVLFGYARHESTRRVLDNIAGHEAADGGYNSFYISPSLAMTYIQPLSSGFELRPGARFAYTYGHYGSYTENGTTNSNLNFKGRGVNIADGRMQLALARTFADDRGEIEVRGGATLAQYSNSNAGASLGGGSAISYRVSGDDVIYGGYTGVRLHYAITDRATLGGDFEYVRRSGREDSVLGYMRLAIKF